MKIFKYPRTPHIEGSRSQPGDEDLKDVPVREIAGRPLVIEEKLDGANSAISFDDEGRLYLQSRGHFLLGGGAEKHFDLFKRWAHTHASALGARLGARYVLYGEWLYAKHTIFYDHLSHYFIEFDLFDKGTGEFLDSARRRELLAGLPLVAAPILYQGTIKSGEELAALIGPSQFIRAGHLERLRALCVERGLNPDRAVFETDASTTMEGLYIKVEEAGVVAERYKFVRASFLQAVEQADSHWLSRPILPNLLRDGADIFATETQRE